MAGVKPEVALRCAGRGWRPLLPAGSDDDFYRGFWADTDDRRRIQDGVGIAYAPLDRAMIGGSLVRKKSDEAAVY